MAAELDIIVPTYSRTDLLATCLASLKAQTWDRFSVIVVDDASPDDVQAVVNAASLPEARVLRLGSNAGFAAAVNVGLGDARAPHVMLLNDDVTLAPDCLERLMAMRDAADMLTPLVLFDDDRDTIYTAGDRILENGRPESIGFRAHRATFMQPNTIFGVSGCAGVFRRGVFDACGYLDERFVAYFEDADLCFRARLAGFTAALVAEAEAYHAGSASLEGRTAWRSVQCFRNHAVLVLKNMPLPLLARFGPAYVRERLHQTRRLLMDVSRERGAAAALGAWASQELRLIRLLPHIVRGRVGNARRRAVPTRTIRALLGR